MPSQNRDQGRKWAILGNKKWSLVNRRRRLRQVYRDFLGSRIESHRAYPILMPDTAVLVPAEGGLRKSHKVLVYRQSTDLETSREFMSYFQVARPNSPVESVIRLVGHGNHLIECLEDRKSTRLNSSHSQISYAVFCLKKKKTTTNKSKSRSR